MAGPPRYARYYARALKLLSSPAKLRTLITEAGEKLLSPGAVTEKFAEVKDDLELMLAMLKAWVAGDYQAVYKTTIASIAGALLYFVAPLDAIPDFLLGLGLLDDAAVVTYVVGKLRAELDAFAQWRYGRSATPTKMIDHVDDVQPPNLTGPESDD